MSSQGADKFRSAMARPCKIFISIDDEGLLYDAISISDVANFDCYESVMKSAQRIIAMFNQMDEGEVSVDRMFYYKRRARCNRMNPVPLLTTTDVFRAVAEHPNGEVPIGVHWSKQMRTKSIKKPKPVDKPQAQQNMGVLEVIKLEQGLDSQNEDVQASALKRKVQHRKPQDMSSADALSSTDADENLSIPSPAPSPVSTASSTDTVKLAPTRIDKPAPDTAAPGESAADTQNYPTIPTPFSHNVRVKTLYPDPGVHPGPKTRTPSDPNRVCNHTYKWPGTATCEIVFNYDGISERRKVNPALVRVIRALFNDDYDDLKPEVAQTIMGQGIPRADNLDKLKEMGNFTYNGVDGKNMITTLKGAKMEIYKVLALLTLSQSRFDDLLAWMRTLKLVEGQQGKFYLTERRFIGSQGLKVMFDSEKEVANRLGNLKAARASYTPPTSMPHVSVRTQKPVVLPILSSKGRVQVQTGYVESGTTSDEPPSKVVLSDGTILVPVPSKPIPASEVPANGAQSMSMQGKTSVLSSSAVSLLSSPASKVGNSANTSSPSTSNSPSYRCMSSIATNTDYTPKKPPPRIIRATATKRSEPDTPETDKTSDPVPMKMFKSLVTDQSDVGHNYRTRSRKGKARKYYYKSASSDEDEPNQGNDETLLPELELPIRIKEEPVDYVIETNLMTAEEITDKTSLEEELGFTIKTEPVTDHPEPDETSYRVKR